MNCTPVRTLGDTMERLARPAMPARQPQTKPVIREAIRGRFRRTATPYRAGSVVPAIRAEEAAARAVWRSSLFLVLKATARDTPPRDRFAPISEGITVPSMPVSEMVCRMVGVNTRCMPVMTSRGQRAPMMPTARKPSLACTK